MLVVDDEELIRWALRAALEGAGHRVVCAADGAEALARFEEGVDAVLLDYRLPDVDGLTLLARMRELDPVVPVTLLTAFSSVERAVDAMRLGAFDFLAKPFDLDHVVAVTAKALETTSLRREVRAMRARQLSSIDAIVGESPAIVALKRQLAKFARSASATILITGETGTGKDLAARAVHAASARADGPFQNITCSALPESLLESELFGHEKGAFTDARTQKRGLLELADRGTVFLDEIGELALPLQAKLLRFLEERTFRRVGGLTEVRPDVRVVAATHRDLARMVEEGTFREDLFYRLGVLSVHIPPLRERAGDVPLLARAFVAHFARDLGANVVGIGDAALDALARHGWPGNVRELRNVIERAVLLAEHPVIEPSDLPPLGGALAASPPPSHGEPATRVALPPEGLSLVAVEEDLVRQALERARGNRTRAARLLGMNRDQIRYRIEKFGLHDVGRSPG
ncbi:MAG: sigma-54-dependent Fis family transcriptional regulator [Sandaracinaceae bacterium]|nr:sigma-54-dependent Fis family transcriptional regulator [Sandaracinaceae bacterium]